MDVVLRRLTARPGAALAVLCVVLATAAASAQEFEASARQTVQRAAQQAAGKAAAQAMEHGMSIVEVRVKGPGGGRENAVRALAQAGLKITSVTDKSPIPHNGCRSPKRRRV